MAEISIIVPIYNAEKYLKRCIDSILAQTFTDFELILVDDGSPDKCPEICDDYARKDQRVLVIHQKNSGQSAARNAGLAVMTGRYVMFVDSDDLIHHQMLSALYEGITRYNVDISMCDALEAAEVPEVFYENKAICYNQIQINEVSLSELLKTGGHQCYVVWGKLINKEIAKNIPFTENRIFEDNAVVNRWLVRAVNVVCVSPSLYFYTINPAGTTKSGFKFTRTDRLWAIEENIRLFDVIGYNKLRRHFCIEYFTTASYYYQAVRKMPENRSLTGEIRSSMKRVLSAYKNELHLSTDEWLTVYDVLHPIYAKLYRRAHTVKGNLNKLIKKLQNKA